MKYKPVHCYIILAAISFFIYFNALQNGFVFDDESVIVNNESIRSISNIPSYFTGEEGFHKVIGKYYRPLVSTTYAIDYAIGELNPKGYHLTNVIVHVVSTLLLFALLMQLFGKSTTGITASFLGSLVFAVHTIHTEAVTWVSGRTDSLVTLFFFAALLYYAKFRSVKEDTGEKYFYIAILFYALGLLSKEMIITFPVIIILYDLIIKKKSFRNLIQNPKPYLIIVSVTVLYLVIRHLALKDVPDRVSYFYFIDKDWESAAATMIKTIPVYFKLMVVPVNLLYHYNGYIPDAKSFLDLYVVLSIIVIAGLIVFGISAARTLPVVSFAVLFFFVSLLPVMNIVPTMNLMAERFLYMTSFSLSLIAGWIYVAADKKKRGKIAAISILVVGVFYGYLTLERNKDWYSNDTLYATADGVDGNVLLVNAGNLYANKQMYDEAETRYRRAIEIRDRSVLAHHNLGLIYLLRGQLDSAEYRFKRGLELDSLAPDGYFQLASVYRTQGRLDKAQEMLERLQRVSPDYKGSADLLANIRAGEPPEIDYMKNQLIHQKNKFSFQFYSEGKYTEAIEILRELIEINPIEKAGYLNNIAMCYEAMGNPDSAKIMFTESIEMDEDNINAFAGLANIESKLGNKQKAIELYEVILRKFPGDQNARHKLDSLRGSR